MGAYSVAGLVVEQEVRCRLNGTRSHDGGHRVMSAWLGNLSFIGFLGFFFVCVRDVGWVVEWVGWVGWVG